MYIIIPKNKYNNKKNGLFILTKKPYKTYLNNKTKNNNIITPNERTVFKFTFDFSTSKASINVLNSQNSLGCNPKTLSYNSLVRF